MCIRDSGCRDVDARTAAHELYGYKAALRDLGLLEPEEVRAHICDHVCPAPQEARDQEELDRICESCERFEPPRDTFRHLEMCIRDRFPYCSGDRCGSDPAVGGGCAMTAEAKSCRKKWKIAVSILLAVLILLAGGFFWYVSDYYQAEDVALEVLASGDHLEVRDDLTILSLSYPTDLSLIHILWV